MKIELDQIAVVILAAGQSRRFGGQKMDYKLNSSKTILETCIEQYQHVFSNITVVVRDVITGQKMIDLGINVVVADHPNNGMSQSLIVGIQSQSKAQAWLLALGDMPYVKSETLLILASKVQTDNIVAPVCDGRRGNPVIFSRKLKTQLLNLQGDVGAKQVIETNSALLHTVDVSDQGVLHDIDRLKDVL